MIRDMRIHGFRRVIAYVHLLGVEPRLGRGFREDEDQVPGRDAVVVHGPDFWKHEFASDPSVLGRTVRLNGREFTVIGVAPATFKDESRESSLWRRPDVAALVAPERVHTVGQAYQFQPPSIRDRAPWALWGRRLRGQCRHRWSD